MPSDPPKNQIPTRRIETQRAMQLTQKAVQFCYLCGEFLDPKRGPISIEHLIQKSGLPKGVGNNSGLWPITLRVHHSCEKKLKATHDDALSIVQQAFTGNMGTMDARSLGKLRTQARFIQGDGPVDGFRFEALQAAVWATLRGLHTALYIEFLPPTNVYFLLPPSPLLNANIQDREARWERDQKKSRTVLGIIDAALRTGDWDGVTAWGGSVRYRCNWHFVEPTPVTPWMCCWTLETPNTREWARRMTGVEVPWRGAYFSASLPRGATRMGETAMNLYN